MVLFIVTRLCCGVEAPHTCVHTMYLGTYVSGRYVFMYTCSITYVVRGFSSRFSNPRSLNSRFPRARTTKLNSEDMPGRTVHMPFSSCTFAPSGITIRTLDTPPSHWFLNAEAHQVQLFSICIVGTLIYYIHHFTST